MKKVYVSNGQTGLVLNESDIIYFAASKKKIFLHYIREAREEIFEFRGAISALEQNLRGENFMRIHRCYIINSEKIRRIEKEWIILDCGREIRLPRGRVYADEAIRRFMSRKEDVIVL